MLLPGVFVANVLLEAPGSAVPLRVVVDAADRCVYVFQCGNGRGNGYLVAALAAPEYGRARYVLCVRTMPCAAN